MKDDSEIVEKIMLELDVLYNHFEGKGNHWGREKIIKIKTLLSVILR